MSSFCLVYKEEPEIAPSRAQYKRILQRRGLLTSDKSNRGDNDSLSGAFTFPAWLYIYSTFFCLRECTYIT